MKYLDFEKHPLVLTCVVVAVAALFSGCATPAKDEPLGVFDAKAAQYQALQKVGESATDAETKRMAIFALAMLNNGSQAPQNPVIVQGGRTGWDFVAAIADKAVTGALGIAPSLFAYRSGIKANETSERIAGINRDVSIAQSTNFLNLGVAGILGTATTAQAGFTALGTAASAPRTSVTVSGNTGSTNIGSGQQLNNSQNPITNPAPVVCTTTAGVTTCSR